MSSNKFALLPLYPWQEKLYQHLHSHPELSQEERETSRVIEDKLRDYDCEVITGIGGYGLVAIFRNGDGPCVLFRADFDGLPVTETTGVSYASTVTVTRSDGVKTGVMHACGHDMHVTALLGACEYLDQHRGDWSGTFIALFQPAEENAAGAQAMVDDDLIHRVPKPDVCLGQHIVPSPAGQVMSAPGPTLAACDVLTITIHGKSAHGSMPDHSIDPTLIAAMIIIRLQGIVAREISPKDFAVITVGTLSAGHSPNTIPATARLVLNTRFYDDAVKEKTYAAIERVVRAECAASGCTIDPELEWSGHGELTDNDPGVFETVRARFDDVFGEDSQTAQRWNASEDFPTIPNAFGVPYLYWFVGATPRTVWDEAVRNDSVEHDVPTNHAPTFLPDFVPTATSCTTAAVVATLVYLGTTAANS